jgi:hypothetical protein
LQVLQQQLELLLFLLLELAVPAVLLLQELLGRVLLLEVVC